MKAKSEPDREWARPVLSRVQTKLRDEYAAEGKDEL
jgi:hypothetical protein